MTKLDLPDDDPTAIDNFLRYLYTLTVGGIIPSSKKIMSSSPDELGALSNLLEVVDKYGACRLGDSIIAELRQALNPDDKTEEPELGLRYGRGTLPSWLSAQEFVETRAKLAVMAYSCETSGIEAFRGKIVEQMIALLPDLLELERIMNILQDREQSEKDLLFRCEIIGRAPSKRLVDLVQVIGGGRDRYLMQLVGNRKGVDTRWLVGNGRLSAMGTSGYAVHKSRNGPRPGLSLTVCVESYKSLFQLLAFSSFVDIKVSIWKISSETDCQCTNPKLINVVASP